MRDAGGIAVLHGGIVWPALRPVGTHRDKRMLRNAAVLCLPIAHVLKGKRVVRILRNLGMHIDHHQQQQHLLWVDLIDRAQPLVKVRRRIDVGTPLPHMRELLDLDPILLDRIKINYRLIAEPFPMGRRRPERMGKIDESLAGETRIHLVQAWTGSLCRERRSGNQERAHSAKHRSPVHIHVLLLIARSQMSRRWSSRKGPRSEERRVGKECRSRWSPYP